MDNQTLLDQLSSLTVGEMVELTKSMEQRFGVSGEARAPAPVETVPLAPVEEQTEFTVTLVEFGPSKVDVIKIVREVTQLGLAESKKVVESAPVIIKDSLNKVDAQALQARFEAAGARVSVS